MPMKVQIITPERSWEPIEATFVALPTIDGEVGVLQQHAPYVTLLGAGKLRIEHAQQADHRYALKGGVAQVYRDEVRILAESVVHADEVDEGDLVARLKQLDAGSYDDPIELAEARAEANWIVTQLRSAGKQTPELQQFG